MATVLPVAVGGATRFIPYIPYEDKEYIARFRLGIRTDTLDITGKVGYISITATADEVEKILERFRAGFLRFRPCTPPCQDGVKLYKLARQGIETEREARK